MFSIKTDKKEVDAQAKVSFESLSSYSLSAGIEYSIFLNNFDHVTLRYEGKNGESLFEVYLRDYCISGISLVCFDGKLEKYDAPFSKPDDINYSILNYRLFMDDDACEIRISPNEIDQKKDFGFVVYSDAIIFITAKSSISMLNSVSDEFAILLDENGGVVGYAVFLSEEAKRLLDTYG